MGGQPELQSPSTNSIAASATSPPENRRIVDQFTIHGTQDVAVKEHSAGQEKNIVNANLKAQFRQACDVMLTNGQDLEQVHQDHDPGFFIENGVAVFIARRFGNDISRWVKQV
jgi:hypothetical protein